MKYQKNHHWLLPGYEDMEISTQMIIEEALKRKIKVDILDREENFLLLSKGKHKEYVKQATFTSKDSLINYFIMQNKSLTKKILKSNGFNVAEGKTYDSIKTALKDYKVFENVTCIVKPLRADAGKGISVVLKNSKSKFEKALQAAYKFDTRLLVEKFFIGEMYRFLVIDQKVAAVMQGVPANVTGDDIHSVSELIKIKNLDPRRVEGIKESPLYPIKIGETENEILKEQKLNLKSVPEKGRRVFLRRIAKNSLGGDTFDMTEIMNEDYKKIALRAMKTIGVKICGVDMIIKDYKLKPTKSNYVILELNFNPSLRVHKYPYSGEKKDVEKNVLDFLGF